MKRTKRKKIKADSLRQKVIRNVLSYHKHFRTVVYYMNMDDLMALTHHAFREDLERGNLYTFY